MVVGVVGWRMGDDVVGTLAGFVGYEGWCEYQRVALWSVVECRKGMFPGCYEVIKGRRQGRREGFVGRKKREWESIITCSRLTRAAIGCLQLFHQQYAHTSRHCVERIATFGSFVKQYRGVLTNGKRRLLGRGSSERPTKGRRN